MIAAGCIRLQWIASATVPVDVIPCRKRNDFLYSKGVSLDQVHLLRDPTDLWEVP
jgi:hypothetical protein